MIQCVLDESRHAEVFAAPTGAGKTVIFLALIKWARENRLPIAIYCCRRLLMSQLSEQLTAAGIDHGIVASGYRKSAMADVNLCMMQTVAARKESPVPNASVIVVDEAHQQKESQAQRVFAAHRKAGATLIGVTATPCEIDHIYDVCHIIVKNSELRRPKCNPPALLEARVYAAPEIDTEGLKQNADGEFSYKELKKRYTPKLFGHVIEHYLRINPSRQPSLLFAPGVAESIWFAQELTQHGIPAAHIDGDDVWVDGELHSGSPELRAKVLERLRAGEIKIICNRFVLREGIDIPQLKHLILATPIGSLLSYVQVVGRVLRYHPSVDPDVIIQDHGGNWYRHGSPNVDRDWAEWFHLPVRVISQMRTDAMKDRQEPQPVACPNCGAVRGHGPVCSECGHRSSKGLKIVLQSNGVLRRMEGLPVKLRWVKSTPSTERIWRECYERARRSNMTFNQARGLFVTENHYWPVDTDFLPKLPLMPRNLIDWYSKVKNVDKKRLF